MLRRVMMAAGEAPVPTLVSRLDFTAMPDGLAATDDTGKSWAFVQAGGSVAVSDGALVTAGGGYITTPDDAEWDFGDDEFCMEALVELSAKAERPVISKWNVTTGLSWFCGCGPGGTNQAFYLRASPGTTTFQTGYSPALNTLYHMAWYRRAGGNFYMSLNGLVTTARGSSTLYDVPTPVTVGANNYQTGGLGMRLYQLRARRGPGSAYPASNFTPPTAI